MSKKKIVISGTGCALADFLYNGISFNSPRFKKYLSAKPCDGGLSPGKLVFMEELEKFSGLPYREILRDIKGNRQHDGFNVGGPSMVSLIHASQLLESHEFEVKFYGIAGRDVISEKIFEIISETPLNIDNYAKTNNGRTPFTHILCDPDFNNGQGGRTFINNLGAAEGYSPIHIDTNFFASDIVCFGGTALLPNIHDNLTALLARVKEKNVLSC